MAERFVAFLAATAFAFALGCGGRTLPARKPPDERRPLVSNAGVVFAQDFTEIDVN